jgi:hypothetical protein
MPRLLVCLLITFALAACSFRKDSTTSNANQSAPTIAVASPAQPVSAAPSLPVSADGLQPGQASGTYTSRGEVVQLKYAYAGRALNPGNLLEVTETRKIVLTPLPTRNTLRSSLLE